MAGALIFWGVGIAIVLWVVWTVTIQDYDAFTLPAMGLGAIVAGLVILRWPYLGLVATAASMPVQLGLPTLPGVGSVVVLLGLLTIGAVAFANALGELPRPRLNEVHVCSGLFVLWMLVSNPAAALLGERMWAATYVQLWFLLLMGGWILEQEGKHRVLAWSFFVTATASVVIGFTAEGMWPPSAVALANRLSGPSGTSNEQAVYLVCAVAFAVFVARTGHGGGQRRRSALVALMVAVCIGGFLATLSRTGFAAAIAVAILLCWREVVRTRTLRPLFFLAFGAGLGAVLMPSQYVIWVVESGWNAIFQGLDTMGNRYVFWQVGMDIWLDSPVSGAGIGSFNEVASNDVVAQLGIEKTGRSGHNSYVNVLSETGSVGLVLFTAFQAAALRGLWRGIPGWPRALSNTWLIILAALMVSGLAHGYQYNKLLWLAAGIGSLGVGRTSHRGVPTLAKESGDQDAEGRLQ